MGMLEVFFEGLNFMVEMYLVCFYLSKDFVFVKKLVLCFVYFEVFKKRVISWMNVVFWKEEGFYFYWFLLFFMECVWIDLFM